MRITLSCRRTNDALGCTGPRWGCFRCVEGDAAAAEEGVPWTEFLHAALDEDGDGRWASFSDPEACHPCEVEFAGGKDEATMSYADGARSTSEASS